MTVSRPAAEVGISIAIVIVVLIVQPGVAVGGMVALVVLAICAASLLPRSRRRGRPRSRAKRR